MVEEMYSERGIRNLMVGVLDVNIKDYFNGILAYRISEEQSKKRKERKTIIRTYEQNKRNAFYAREWIEETRDIHVFSFESICKFIEVDPKKMRKRILAIDTPEKVFDVLSRRKESLFT